MTEPQRFQTVESIVADMLGIPAEDVTAEVYAYDAAVWPDGPSGRCVLTSYRRRNG